MIYFWLVIAAIGIVWTVIALLAVPPLQGALVVFVFVAAALLYDRS